MLKRNNILAIIIGVLSSLYAPSVCKAQSDCIVTLREAQKLYEGGLIEDVPSLLNPCIRRGFNKSEKIQAYRLIILSKLYDDKHDEADSLMLKLLKIDPEFKISPQLDPPEFITLYNSYRTLPTYTVGIDAGLNISDIDVINVYGVHDEFLNEGKYKSGGTGYHIGVSLSRNLYSRVEASLGIKLRNNKLENTTNMFGSISQKGYSTTILEETQTRIDFPINIKFDILKKNIKPFVSVGFCGGYITTDKIKITKQIADGGQPESISDINMKDYRRLLNFWGSYGIGVKYKIKSGNLLCNINYYRGLFNQVQEDKRYEFKNLIYNFYHLDDDYKLGFWSISFGYTYSFHKPKKK